MSQIIIPYHKDFLYLSNLFLHVDKIIESESKDNITTSNITFITKKRNRDNFRKYEIEILIRKIIREMDYLSITSTFKTLLDSKFYHSLSRNLSSEFFDEISIAVQEFRNLMARAQDLLKNERDNLFYDFVCGEIFTLLTNSSQIILLYNMSC